MRYCHPYTDRWAETLETPNFKNICNLFSRMAPIRPVCQPEIQNGVLQIARSAWSVSNVAVFGLIQRGQRVHRVGRIQDTKPREP